MIKLSIPERLETDRLLLQRLRYEDADEIFYTYASKPEATKYVSWPTHQSIKDTRSFLKYAVPAWSKGTEYTFSIRIRSSNRFVGTAGFLHDDGKIQYGYALGPLHWGNGFATEVGQKIMEILKAQTDLHRIGSFVDVENIASIKVLKKIGMKEEAVLTKWFRFVNQGNEPKDCILFKL
jgi:Acetyltransferases, including N-acetylases of ribosomal proteins